MTIELFLYADIVKFMETPRTQLAAEDFPVLLNCSALSGVRECFWTWYEDDTKVAERLIKFNFTRDKDNNYNCSMVIPKVDRSLQGIWQCGVKYGDPRNLRTSYASPFSLTVVKKGRGTVYKYYNQSCNFPIRAYNRYLFTSDVF